MDILEPCIVKCEKCNNLYKVVIFFNKELSNKKDYNKGNTQPDKEAGIGTRQLYKNNCPKCKNYNYKKVSKISWNDFYKS